MATSAIGRKGKQETSNQLTAGQLVIDLCYSEIQGYTVLYKIFKWLQDESFYTYSVYTVSHFTRHFHYFI